MNYEEFQLQLMADLQERLTGDYGPVIIGMSSVPKLQGESYDGITVQKDHSSIAASLNANQLFSQYQAGTDYDAVLGVAEMMARNGMDRSPDISTTILEEYDNIKNMLTVELIPQKGNEEVLASVPHKNIEDLAAVYRVVFSDDADGRATALITNSLADVLHVDLDTLHEDAIASTMAKYPGSIKNMNEVLQDLVGADIDFDDFPESPLYCVTNESKFRGAGVILYPGLLDEAAERLGESFYVLPSSIHEVLIIAESDGSYHALEEMVHQINTDEVAPADRLSDNVYHYDAESHVFELASSYEERMQAAEEILADELPTAEHADTMTVLLVEPNKYPKAVEMDSGLSSLQAAVGGYIECVYPFEEEVGIICNEEGKINGLPLNRALRDEGGEVYDIIAGSFLVVGLTEDNFGSLTPDQMKKYDDLFHQPEAFIKTGRSVIAVPIPDEALGDKAKASIPKAKEQPSL